MPFATIQYRNLRNSTLTWQERRNRFLCLTLTYTSIFLIAGFVFLGLYLAKRNQLNGYTCTQVCGYLNTIYNCGYQQCCDSYDGLNSYYYNSYMFCLGDYLQLVYFIIMITCFSYVVYEILTIICIMCTASSLSGDSNVIVMDNQRGQYVGLTSNYGSPYNNYPPQGNYGNYPPNVRPNPMNQNNMAPNPLNTGKN